MLLHDLLALAIGFALGLPLTSVVIAVAVRYGILDVPADDRRVHSTPVPRLGGVAIFLATGLGVTLVLLTDWVIQGVRPQLPLGRLLPGVAIGATIVFVTGLLDDLKGVAPRFKLVAQTAAALVVISYGFPASSIALSPASLPLHLGWLAIPIAVLWIVGVTNAFNLIDGVDGLAGTFALIGLATCIVADFMFDGQAVLTLTLTMAGAVLAFLRFNKNPARVFLGDSGSMTIGFFLAVRSVVAATSQDGKVVYFLIPLVALAFPITDTFIAIARRWLRGHKFSRADGRHVHHQLLALGLSPSRTVALLGAVYAGFALLGLSVVFAPPTFTLALLGGGAILGFTFSIYAIRYLQYSEFIQFGASILSVMRSARTVVRHKVLAEELSQRIASAKSLREIEMLLQSYREITGLVEVQLVPGRRNFIGPEGQMISPPDALPWRLDYRVGLGDEQRQELLLRVWCNAPSAGTSHGSAERFAMRIGPAIERWIQANPQQLPREKESASDSGERSTRISGETPTHRF